jgi:hypothetical protein
MSDRCKSYATCNAQAGMRRIPDTCLYLGVNDSLDSVMGVRWQWLCRKGVLEIREQIAGQHGGRNHPPHSNDIVRYEIKNCLVSFRNGSSSVLLRSCDTVWIQLARKYKPLHYMFQNFAYITRCSRMILFFCNSMQYRTCWPLRFCYRSQNFSAAI